MSSSKEEWNFCSAVKVGREKEMVGNMKRTVQGDPVAGIAEVEGCQGVC